MISEMMPNAGKIRMYTSGCPKNQKMCWNITGSPPPDAGKNDVAKKWSVSSIVTAPASTGMVAMSRYAVISQLQQNSGMLSRPTPGARMFMIVTTTLMEPRIDDAPIRWMAKIAIGKPSPPCSDSGGYRVQPPAGEPPGTNSVLSSSVKANGRIQNEKLLSRGSAMSGAPTCMGII